MKSIAVWIQKGGSGKTSTAANLAYALRDHGRTLLVDADPQGNLSSWIGPESFPLELADVLRGAALAEAVHPVRPGLDILPTLPLGTLKGWAETTLPGQPFAFLTLRDKIQDAGYRFAVWDLSPGASILERSIVAAVDEVLPVARPEIFSVDGLEVFADSLERIRRDLRSSAVAPRLVVNGLNRSISTHRAYYAQLAGSGFQVYTIGTSSKVPESQLYRRFLAEHDPASPLIEEYTRLGRGVA